MFGSKKTIIIWLVILVVAVRYKASLQKLPGGMTVFGA